LLSGQSLSFWLGDALILLSIVLLLIEMVKAARPGAKFAMDHILSLILAGCALAELLLLPQKQFASMPFVVLTALMFVDAFAGIAINWRFRRYRKWAHAEVERAKQIERQAELKMERAAEREMEKQVAPAPVIQPAAPQPVPTPVSPSGPPPAANEQTTS
jgi:membrane-bound ClpP family serine protease